MKKDLPVIVNVMSFSPFPYDYMFEVMRYEDAIAGFLSLSEYFGKLNGVYDEKI